MARVVYAARALDQLGRTVALRRRDDPAGAPPAVAAIQSAIASLAAHPLLGRRLERELRELVISVGKTGYVALYRFAMLRDEVHVLAIRQQRELGFMP